MISKSFTVMGVLAMLSATAGSALKELYGKSITLQWSETSTGGFRGDQFTRHLGRAYQMNIYISPAGRSFVRFIGTNTSGFSHQEYLNGTGRPILSAPGESTDRVDFQRRSILVYREFESGVRRIAVDLNGTGCKATVINGRQAGKKIVRQTGQGLTEESSVEVTPACAQSVTVKGL
jgi:hypothetical protein